MAGTREDTLLLNGKKDRFHGLTIKTNDVGHQSDEEFEERLRVSLLRWKQDGKRGLWIEIAIEHSSVVPVCARHGFNFHHARPGYVMMTRWLPDSEQNTIPEFANQYLGAGGFVVNDEGKVLVITENYFNKTHWKLPGGHADIGEEIGAAAIRETFEETGVKCTFITVLTFRHMHGYRHGLSDFYFICLLRPITEEINKCEREIADCRWIDIDEYYSDENTSAVNKFIVDSYRDYKENGVSLSSHEVLNYYKTKYDLMYKATKIDVSGPVAS